MSKRLMLKTSWLLAAALCLAVAGCSYTPELFCDQDHPCEDPERPFCDVEGTYPASEGIAKTCIPTPFDAAVNVPDAGPDAREDAAGNLDAPLGDGAPATHTLTVVVAGSGNGTVVSNPFGVNCPGTCAADFADGTTVTLTASPEDDSDFVAWSGGGCPTDGTESCELDLSADVTITATLDLKEYELTVTPGGDGTGEVSSDVAGIDCSSADPSTGCTATYTHGTAVELTATPTGASSFGGWSGDCSGMDPDACSLVMDGAKSVGAAFDLNKFTLSVSVSGPGSVTSGDGLIDCPGDCSESYDSGSSVTLTAHYDAAVTTFDGWSGGGCAGSGATCEVTVTASTSVQATFTAITYDLTVHKTGSDASGGLVTSVSSSGINCGTDCSQTYGALTAVSLQASFDPSLTVFGGWSGACSGTNPVICSFNMDSDKDVYANFTVRQYPLTVSVSGAGGTVSSSDGLIDCPTDCNQDYDVGSPVTLNANYNSSVTTFNGWSGDCDTINGDTCTLTISGSTSVQASFSGVTHNLDVTKTGLGEGRVYSDPTGIDCGSTCQYPFAALTSVNLYHQEIDGAVFMGWSGACSGDTCSVTMNADKDVSAEFCAPRACGALECGSVDDGCNGTMDCGTCCTALADHSCVQEAPSGWVGPVIRWGSAASATPPSCSSTSYPTLLDDSNWLINTPGTCDCDCDPATGITCPNTTLSERGGDVFCQLVYDPASQSIAPNQCGQLSAAMLTAERLTFADPSPTNAGSCAEVVTNTLSAAYFGNQTRVCSGASVDDGICTTTGEVCAPAATGEFAAKLCIFRDNYEGPCPAGDYSELMVRYGDIDDGRSCTTCICGDPTSECTGHLKLQNNCTASATTYWEGDAGGCPHIDSATYFFHTTVPSGTCTHTGGVLTGEATGTQPVALCCMP